MWESWITKKESDRSQEARLKSYQYQQTQQDNEPYQWWWWWKKAINQDGALYNKARCHYKTLNDNTIRSVKNFNHLKKYNIIIILILILFELIHIVVQLM